MSHETARQRARRHKRDPFRAAQIAPKHPVEPVRCARPDCAHAALMHGYDGRCKYRGGCECTEYLEANGARS